MGRAFDALGRAALPYARRVRSSMTVHVDRDLPLWRARIPRHDDICAHQDRPGRTDPAHREHGTSTESEAPEHAPIGQASQLRDRLHLATPRDVRRQSSRDGDISRRRDWLGRPRPADDTRAARAVFSVRSAQERLLFSSWTVIIASATLANRKKEVVAEKRF